jgi:hypothetical protein
MTLPAALAWSSTTRAGPRSGTLVGLAAAGFTADWSRPVRRLPTGDDIRAFVADYERARRRAFSTGERRAVFASCVSTIAYGARCSHALEPATVDWPPDTWPHLLRTEGPALLAEATAC